MIKTTIFWDFDGVMADSTNFVFSYWQQAFKQHGIDFTLSDYQKTFTYKFPFDCLHEVYGDKIVTQIYQDYSAYEEKEYAQQVQVFSGFIEQFNHAVAGRYDNHIVSSNLASVINPWLSKYQIQSHFSSVVGREVNGYKDEKIKKTLSQTNCEPKSALFVGDTISDIEHAQKVGIQSVAVSWGVHSRDQLETANPDYLFDTQSELFTLLTK